MIARDIPHYLPIVEYIDGMESCYSINDVEYVIKEYDRHTAKIVYESYYINGKLYKFVHYDTKKNYIVDYMYEFLTHTYCYHNDGKLYEEYWTHNDELHNENGPALIDYETNTIEYYWHGQNITKLYNENPTILTDEKLRKVLL